MTEDDAVTEIRNLENQRISALLSKNLDKLAKLMGDDLVHVHANGRVENKAEYLAAVAEKYEFLQIERSSLNIKLIGDAAVVSGALVQDVRIMPANTLIKMSAVATQVWVRRAGGWVQSNFQATRVE
jgi:uncharacterized protein (TIGR02246 family)